MALIVQKYGGTSVGTPERMRSVARRVANFRAQGHRVVVVVSAMSGETNSLIELARAVAPSPRTRELDVVVSTGEQVSIGLLCMALDDLGVPARSYTGAQVRILTDSTHTRARILDIDAAPIRKDLDAGGVVVVAGFQGVDAHGNITTLGRGGSDTTAVALAAALEADECQIYTDVDGVYTADPRVVPEARKLDAVRFEEMLELASLGSKVLQIRAVEFAAKYKVKLRVLSSFEEDPGEGTFITVEESSNMERPVISGIAFVRDEAKLTLTGVPDRPGIAYQILGPIADAGIDVGMIIQNAPPRWLDRPLLHRRARRSCACREGARRRAGPRRRALDRERRHHVQGLGGGGRHALAPRRRREDVPHPGRGGHQHPDDHELRDPHLGGDRGEAPRARGARPAQGLWPGCGR